MLQKATDLKEEIQRLKSHDHVCLIYKTPEEWVTAVTAFLAAGLTRNEKCVYVTDANNIEEICALLDAAGIDVVAWESSGGLTFIKGAEFFIQDWSFDPDRTIARLTAESKKAFTEGFSALRLTAEMSWVLRGPYGFRPFSEYEVKLNRDFFPKYGCVGMCQYDYRKFRFSPEIIKQAVFSHPLLIVGSIVYSNPFYIPAGHFVGEKGVAREVRLLLDQVQKGRKGQAGFGLEKREERVILDSMSERVLLYDRSLKVLLANRAAGESVGVAPEKLVGRYRHQIWQKHAAPCQDCPVEKAFATGETQESETVTADGRVWLVRSCPLRNEGGIVFSVVEISQEITERKRAEEKIREYQEQLRLLASELTFAEERERRRIAVDLHDFVGQTLAVAKIKLAALQEMASTSGLGEPLSEVQGYIEEAIKYTRSLIYEISSPLLYEFGLEPAVEQLVQQVQEQHAITAQFINDGQPKPVNHEAEISLFRALRELLTNVIKHARAQNVRVHMRRDGDYLQMTVEDDGIGFDTSNIGFGLSENGARFGLFNIRERMVCIGGSFAVKSQPWCGTVVTLRAPLRRHEPGKE